LRLLRFLQRLVVAAPVDVAVVVAAGLRRLLRCLPTAGCRWC
jgi:hypothetical protein